MVRFLVRRLVNYIALCLVATFLAFSLAALTFDPVGRLMERNPPPPQSVIDAKRAELRLDEPIPTRFAAWLGGVVQGDFGQTTVNTSVSEELPRRAGVSLRLFLIGTIVGISLGVIVGVAGAIRQYKFSDYVITLFSFVILSTPVFLLGLLLKYGALEINSAVGSQLLVFTGETTPGFQGGFGAAALLDRLQHLVLPTITIALGQIAYYSRYQRSAMLDVLGSDFLRTAQAKGLTRRKALYKHGLRTALVPMATLFAFGFGLLITGGVFTERIFGWFGMGDWLVYGVQQDDINITAAVTLFVAVLVLISGWLSDVFYALLDPRVRLR
jgi:glutathione transport system permease protein